MIISKAAPIQMVSDIPDSEIKMAKLLNNHLSLIENKISSSVLHLNGLYEPFKTTTQPIPVEETINHRVHLRDFRDQVKENFNKIVELYSDKNFKKYLEHFSIDTQINELISSFENSFEDVEKQVDLFLPIFSDLSAVDFKDRVVASIEGIKKQCAQLKQVINDRFIQHIEENILENSDLKAVANFNKEKENLINKFASFNFKV